jgi:hypothetical protein
MKSIFLSKWNFIRVLRLVIGVFIIVQGIQTKEWVIATVGGLFALLALLNTGCCSVGGCKRQND